MDNPLKVAFIRLFDILIFIVSQDNLIKLISQGDEAGKGRGHVYYTFKNKKNNAGKLTLKKYNPVARKRTVYKEGK